ncbi:MAG: hypothetical protein ACKVPX_16610 [Myxococcaceae bacterium]
MAKTGFLLMLVALATGCPSGDPYTLSGTATYDWLPAADSGEGGVRLNYGVIARRPIRRATVQAVDPDGNEVLAEGITDDNGAFELSVTSGRPSQVRVLARSAVSAFGPEGVSPDACSGAAWDVTVVDNTQGNARWSVQEDNTRSASASDVAIHAALTTNGALEYTSRVAAPFALLDTLITEIEFVCSAQPGVSLPALRVHWSPNNTDGSGGNVSNGSIGTSFYTRESDGTSALYILGREDADTDEYDDHVIAHEFGHFLEDRLYRSDSLGGPHSFLDALALTVAFGEGYGNAVAGMTLGDPVYVDTKGTNQQSGFDIDVSQAPTGDDRGVYSETSVQWLLWSLFENRNATPNSGQYDRIHTVLREDHRTQAAMTTAQSFAAHYNARFGGSAESLQTLWNGGTGLATPYASLCQGACSGTGDTADTFDIDNDIGNAYAATRNYPPETAGTFPAAFWQLYRTLSTGTNSATAHDQTQFANYGSGAYNKFGVVRWYRYASPGGSTSVGITNLGAGSCSTDLLDLYVYQAGQVRAANVDATGGSAGCPGVTFSATAGVTYIFEVIGYTSNTPSWSITVNP